MIATLLPDITITIDADETGHRRLVEFRPDPTELQDVQATVDETGVTIDTQDTFQHYPWDMLIADTLNFGQSIDDPIDLRVTIPEDYPKHISRLYDALIKTPGVIIAKETVQ